MDTTQEVPNSVPTSARLSFGQLWNMNLGFLGIQFAWGLQMANMSAIFEYLGAEAHQIPLLWLAAPLTGLIVQPVIGNLSDRTWTFLGRRRPYFLLGAVLAAIALLLMPNCTSIWVAASLLWLLDSSNNLTMVPFRAFVGDMLPLERRTQGFAMQTIMSGIGAVSASALPWILDRIVKVNPLSDRSSPIPQTIAFSFYIGAILFLVTICWTIITTPEEPPADLAELPASQSSDWGIVGSFQEIWAIITDTPVQMQQIAKIQFFTWLGVFCFCLYFPPAVAHNIFGAVDRNAIAYSEGIEWAGLCFALYNGACVVFSWLLLPRLIEKFSNTKTSATSLADSQRQVHGFCLLCGGIALVSMLFFPNRYFLLLAMLVWGVAWSSILTLPYAMLSETIPPDQRGIYQGIFNFYIVLPEILMALGFGWIMRHWLDNNCLLAVALGGVCLLIAAGLTQLERLPEQSNSKLL